MKGGIFMCNNKMLCLFKEAEKIEVSGSLKLNAFSKAAKDIDNLLKQEDIAGLSVRATAFTF